MRHRQHSGTGCTDSLPPCALAAVSVRLLRCETLIHCRFPEGRKEADSLSTEFPDHAGACYLRAKAGFWSGQDALSLTTAEQHAERCLRIDASHAGARRLLLQLRRLHALRAEAAGHARCGRHDAAAKAWTEAMSVEPANHRLAAAAALSRATARAASGQHTEAEQDCTLALDRWAEAGDPPRLAAARAHTLRADSRAKIGNANGAAEDAEAACALHPSQQARRRAAELREAAEDAAAAGGGGGRRWHGTRSPSPRRARPPSPRRATPLPTTGRPDHYQLLGCVPSDSAARITARYRRCAMQWHPDKWASASESDRIAAEERFKAMSASYAVLSDPTQRRRYDLLRAVGLRDGAHG